MKWLIFDHVLTTKWFSLMLEVFFWAGKRNMTVNENPGQCYFLEEVQWGWREGADRPSQPSSQVWALWLGHLSGGGAVAGRNGRTNIRLQEHQLHWWVMQLYKVKAGCCGWKMQNNRVLIRVTKPWPYAPAKKHFQPAVFHLLGQMLSFDSTPPHVLCVSCFPRLERFAVPHIFV